MHRALCLFLLSAGTLAYAADLTSLLKRAEKEKVQTVEAFLGTLPEDILGHFTLMEVSKSKQHATPDDPRAILFDSRGEIFLTFDATSNFVEVIERKPKGALEFRRVDFLAGSPPKVSPPNPKECRTCHGNPLFFRWASYPKWEGAYGNDVNDRLQGKAKDRFLAFRERTKKHLRYGLLRFEHYAKGEVAPYSESPSDQKYVMGPNTQLNAIVARTLRDQVHASLERHPRGRQFALALVLASLDCTPSGLSLEEAQRLDTTLGEYRKVFTKLAKSVPNPDHHAADNPFDYNFGLGLRMNPLLLDREIVAQTVRSLADESLPAPLERTDHFANLDRTDYQCRREQLENPEWRDFIREFWQMEQLRVEKRSCPKWEKRLLSEWTQILARSPAKAAAQKKQP